MPTSLPEKADSAKKQIEGVIETFRTAIINRDKDRFTGLFLHEQARCGKA